MSTKNERERTQKKRADGRSVNLVILTAKPKLDKRQVHFGTTVLLLTFTLFFTWPNLHGLKNDLGHLAFFSRIF